jgi:hypothetical protein
VTLFDIHYFDYEDADYPENWEEEIFLKRRSPLGRRSG